MRTLDGRRCPVLSDRYRVLDNDDLANVALPVLMEHGFEVISSEITERKFYLKAVTARIQAEVKPGDVVQAGIVLSNSEIGQGTLKIEPLLFFLVCSNGLVMPEASMRRQHVGRYIGELESAERYYQHETRRADDVAFWLKVRDVLTGTLKEPAFTAYLEKLRGATAQPIAGDPIEVVEVTAKLQVSDPEKHSVLRHFLGGHNGQQELTKYRRCRRSPAPARTQTTTTGRASSSSSGGQIIELAPSQWKTISEARV